MYSEKTKRKETGILFIIIIILILYFTTRFTYSLSPSSFKVLIEIGNVIIVCYLTWLIIRFKITDYIYTIEKNILRIDKQLGKRITNELSLELKRIVNIEKIENLKTSKYSIKKTFNFGPYFFKKNKYCIIYKENDSYYAFSFQPSEKFLKLLREKV